MKYGTTFLFLLSCVALAIHTSPARASCEGASPATLLAAWYDPAQNTLIIETGDADESEFNIERNGVREPAVFMYTKNMAGLAVPAVGLTRANGAVDDHAPSDIARRLQDRVGQQAGKLNYRQMIDSLHGLIVHDMGFKALSPMTSCPYRLHGMDVMRGDTSVGTLADVPGDERSPTTISPTPTCWGAGDRPVLLAFHWEWECQGTGDLPFLLPKQP